jgi:prepilin-type processing-associated H-X9-DG protein
MLPAAGWQNPSFTLQVSWDSLINSYIGGHFPQAEMQNGTVDKDLGIPGLQILVCPSDTFPRANWAGGTLLLVSLRSYAMVGTGVNWVQVDPKNGLPSLNAPGALSVGIYWDDPNWTSTTVANWNPPGYKSTVVADPSGTILLCENTSGQQLACNIQSCCCLGPQSTSPNVLYQTDNNSGPQDPTVSPSVNEGQLLYKAQRNRFNYVFIDGHIETLPMEKTIGTGTLTAPKGMWTCVQGD